MNIQESGIVNFIFDKGYTSQRELAEGTGCSLGKVNSTLKSLKAQGLIDENNMPTALARELEVSSRPANAVILAAGYGMRMVPLNVEKTKGLIEINGETLIERQIRMLHEKGITDITVIVGFMKEQYEFLIDKYGVVLKYNGDYSVKNNIHSLKKAAGLLGNTYIIPCDLWFRENPFAVREWASWYMLSDEMTVDSSVRINRKGEIVSVRNSEQGNAMIGLSYIHRDDAGKIRDKLLDYADRREYDHSFWEECLFEGNKMTVAARMIPMGSVYEINTYEQLRSFNDNSKEVRSTVMELLKSALNCADEDISDIEPLKSGMTNRSFLFRCRDKRYIMRIPGEGTDKLIDRKHEYDTYQQIMNLGICDPVIYMNPDNGYKITEFIEETHNCDPMNPEEVRACMKKLKTFHEMKLKVGHEFDIYEQAKYYEKLRGNVPSLYRDYDETRSKVEALRKYVEAQPRTMALTHIDAVCDNFLFKGDDIYLIDWEYAGMQDIHVDIAMFAIYAMYDREHVEQLIDAYFDGNCPIETRVKIYCYIASCGFLWSNWCEYKHSCGVEFGEYSLAQYRYAKEYYDIVVKEYGEIYDKSR